MKRVRSTLQISPLRAIALATCCLAAPGLALAQDQEAQTQQILEGIQNGERVQIQLPDPE
ncbi:MAG: peptidase S41, partial [Gammaproteobacteria bacterium HGW-Gammaproteobacteria-5]